MFAMDSGSDQPSYPSPVDAGGGSVGKPSVMRQCDNGPMPLETDRSHQLKAVTRHAVHAALAAAVLVRGVELVRALRLSDEGPLLAFPLSVIFPALLVVVLTLMPPAISREGALMRLGTMVHCLLIVALPRLALHLALGLPVVFLVVELFETRCPRPLHDAIVRRIVA